AELVLGDGRVLRLPAVVAEQLVDQVFPEIDEMQAEIGRDAVDVAVVALRVYGALREDVLDVGGNEIIDRRHERSVLADVVRRRQHDVEFLRTRGGIGEHLVKEAVTAEIDEVRLAVGSLANRIVVLVNHLPQGYLCRSARPSKNGYIGERSRRPDDRDKGTGCARHDFRSKHLSSLSWLPALWMPVR